MYIKQRGRIHYHLITYFGDNEPFNRRKNNSIDTQENFL